MVRRGAKLITDSICVFDLEAGVMTYESPIGPRRTTLLKSQSLLDRVDHRFTVSPDTGLVTLVRPSDLLGQNNAAPGFVDHVVHLEHAADQRVRRTHERILPWFTSIPEFQQGQILAAEHVVATSSPDSTTESAAERILTTLE